MEIKPDSLQAKMIADALRSQIDVMRDCAFDDEKWRADIENLYGIPLEFVIYSMEGLIGEVNGTATNLMHGGLQRIIRAEVAEAVRAGVAKAVAEMIPLEPVERVSVSEVASRTTTVERPAQKSIAAGETDKTKLLEILRSGRKLTPQQRKILGMKRCSRCTTIKPFLEFKTSHYADGFFAWCKACDTPKEVAAESVSAVPESSNRVGLIKCNQCSDRFSPREIMEHKRKVHPVSDVPFAENDHSLVGSSLNQD